VNSKWIFFSNLYLSTKTTTALSQWIRLHYRGKDMHALRRFEQTQWNMLFRFVLLERTYLLDPSIIVLRWSSCYGRPRTIDARFSLENVPTCLDPYVLFSPCVLPRDHWSARRRAPIGFLAAFALRCNLEYFSDDSSRPSIDKLGHDDDGLWLVYLPAWKKKGYIYIYIILRRYIVAK